MFYYIKRKRLKTGGIQYYLYKCIYIGKGKKKHISLGRIDQIEQLLENLKTQKTLPRIYMEAAVAQRIFSQSKSDCSSDCSLGATQCHQLWTRSLVALPVPSEEEFRQWMEFKGFLRRTIEDKLRYLRKLPRIVTPEMILSGEIPFNNHMQQTLHYIALYLFETGRLSLENQLRWDRLLKQVLRERNKRLRAKRERGAQEVCDEDILAILRRVKDSHYYIVGKILLASGARASEIGKLFTEYDPRKWEHHNGVSLYKMKWYRGYKICEYIFLPTEWISEIEELLKRIRRGEKIKGKKMIVNERRIQANLAPVSKFRDYLYQKMKDMGYEEEARFIESRELPVSEEHYDKIKKRAIQAYKQHWKPHIKKLLTKI